MLDNPLKKNALLALGRPGDVQMLETLGRDRAVKEVSELARKAKTPREAVRYIRWLAELEGWIKPGRRVRRRKVTRACSK